MRRPSPRANPMIGKDAHNGRDNSSPVSAWQHANKWAGDPNPIQIIRGSNPGAGKSQTVQSKPDRYKGPSCSVCSVPRPAAQVRLTVRCNFSVRSQCKTLPDGCLVVSVLLKGSKDGHKSQQTLGNSLANFETDSLHSLDFQFFTGHGDAQMDCPLRSSFHLCFAPETRIGLGIRWFDAACCVPLRDTLSTAKAKVNAVRSPKLTKTASKYYFKRCDKPVSVFWNKYRDYE